MGINFDSKLNEVQVFFYSLCRYRYYGYRGSIALNMYMY